jgi:predicted porin
VKLRNAVWYPALLLLAPVAQAADSSDVTLYGQARISLDNTDNGRDETARVSNGESRVGVRGAENLGNGMKAVFQLEVNVNLDDGAGSTGSLFGTARNSYVGLAGGFGTFTLGIINTPYRESTDDIDLFGNSLGDYNSIISEVGNNDIRAEFNRREPNTINYWSPKLNGFQLRTQYRVDETASSHKDRYSVSGLYENGPWFASLAYDNHQDENDIPPAVGAHDTAGTKLGLAYTFNKVTKLGFVYETLSQDGGSGRFDRDAWYLGLSHKAGNNIFKIGFAQAEDNDAMSDSGADFFVIGLTHNVSKRTELFGLYAQTDNESNGGYGLGSSTSGAVAAPFDGADLSSFSVGMNHKF